MWLFNRSFCQKELKRPATMPRASDSSPTDELRMLTLCVILAMFSCHEVRPQGLFSYNTILSRKVRNSSDTSNTRSVAHIIEAKKVEKRRPAQMQVHQI
jgi:hypothetical protein